MPIGNADLNNAGAVAGPEIQPKAGAGSGDVFAGAWSGRRVLIAGLGGIGQAIARRLAVHGALVYGTFHSNAESAEAFGATLPQGSWAGSVALDAASPDSAATAFTAASSSLGGAPDTLVVTTGHRHDLEFFASQDPAVTSEIIDVELLGPMNLVRKVLPAMQEAGFGRIVLIGSDSGKAGTMGDAASSAARAGLAGFARSIARETARTDITINVVNPGPTDSPLLESMLADEDLTGKVMKGTVGAVPKRRTARAEEIAEAVAYLGGPNSGFTTGQVLSVSGGLTM